MTDVRRILHPTDFSDNARAALPLVLEYVQLHGAELHVIHVLEPMVSTTDFTWAGLNHAELEARRLEGATEALAEYVESIGRPQVVSAVVRGKNHEAICEYARAEAIDLIVLCTHGHSGLSHLLLGSTAELVVRTAPCPVLTLKAPAA